MCKLVTPNSTGPQGSPPAFGEYATLVIAHNSVISSHRIECAVVMASDGRIMELHDIVWDVFSICSDRPRDYFKRLKALSVDEAIAFAASSAGDPVRSGVWSELHKLLKVVRRAVNDEK